MVTVTATDPDDLTADPEFRVIVPNRPPMVRSMPDAVVEPGGAERWDRSQYFEDQAIQELTYSAMSSNPAVVTVVVSGVELVATGVDIGTATITVVASDAGALTATQEVGFEATASSPRLNAAASRSIRFRISSCPRTWTRRNPSSHEHMRECPLQLLPALDWRRQNPTMHGLGAGPARFMSMNRKTASKYGVRSAEVPGSWEVWR